MIEWSVDVARASGLFARIVVSTDDAEVADIAVAAGAEVPFVRPAELADDHTPTVPVVAHAAEVLMLEDEVPVCSLYPTAPFVRASDLAAGLTLLEAGRRSYVVTVVPYTFPIQRALRRAADGGIEMIAPEHMLTRSQDLEEAWHDAGQFYWGLASTWRSGAAVFGPGAVGLALPPHRVVDIDTQEDWSRAEALFHVVNERENQD